MFILGRAIVAELPALVVNRLQYCQLAQAGLTHPVHEAQHSYACGSQDNCLDTGQRR